MQNELELALWKGKSLTGPFGLLYGLLVASRARTSTEYARFSMLASILVAAPVFLLSGPGVSAMSLLLAFAFLASIPFAVASSIREEVERKLVPALYAASRMPHSASAIDVISRLSEQRELGILGGLFGEAYATLVKSAGRRGVEEIFAGISSRVGSKKLERVFLVLSVGLSSTGNDNGGLLMLKSAEDLEDIQLLSEKKSASLASQKYIILLGSALLVPFILGAVSAMMGFFSSLGPAFSGMGISLASGGAALGRALWGYVAIQAALASLWVAFSIDERPSRVAIYLPMIMASALAVYGFATKIITA